MLHARKGDAAKQAAIVIDANTGRVLHEQAGDELRFPASLTKMMTLYMLFGEIEQDVSPIKARSASASARTAWRRRSSGSRSVKKSPSSTPSRRSSSSRRTTLRSQWRSRSAALEYQFAQMMTERAHQIGMRNTTFRNASGLPNPGQFSTARDMVTLALRLQDDYPQHYRHFSLASFAYGGKVYKSHNTLMRGFPGMDGVKTGYYACLGVQSRVVGASGRQARRGRGVRRHDGGDAQRSHAVPALRGPAESLHQQDPRALAKLIASARKPAKPAPVLAARCP